MEELKDRGEYQNAIGANGVIVLEGMATWSRKCQEMRPLLEKMVTEFPKAHFYMYDIEEASDIVNELGAHPMPTFHVFKNGEIVETIEGPYGVTLEKAIKSCYDN